MQIEITDVARSTGIVIAVLLAGLLLSLRRARHEDPLPVPVSQELKGLAILAIVFAHVSFMLVTDYSFLHPLSLGAGVGVDLFLFMSGHGLTLGMLRQPLAPPAFYRRRLVRVFIPLWVVLAMLFAADAAFLGRTYPASYVLQSFLGVFPSAIPTDDVNSPFWYISWLLMYYLLFPLLFTARRPWLTAIALAVIANTLAVTNPLDWQADWLHRLHSNAFSLGMLLAWALQVPSDGQNRLVAALRRLREGSGVPAGLRYGILAAFALVAAYLAANGEEWKWPVLAAFLRAAGYSDHFFIGQAASLIAMAAVILLFMARRVECRLLHLFGAYSYETYLLHWPLMSRYDFYFRHLPAWAALFLWLATLLGLGWALQRLTTPLGRWLDTPYNRASGRR